MHYSTVILSFYPVSWPHCCVKMWMYFPDKSKFLKMTKAIGRVISKDVKDRAEVSVTRHRINDFFCIVSQIVYAILRITAIQMSKHKIDLNSIFLKILHFKPMILTISAR